MRIFTHQNPDLDAIASIWAAKTFGPENWKNAPIEFVPANWKGYGLEDGDVALDVDADGLGIKGDEKDGRVLSCFSTLIGRWAPTDIQRMLAPLVRFIDIHDSRGQAVKHLTKGLDAEAVGTLSATSLASIFNALKSTHRGDDETLISRMSEIFSGILEAQKSYTRAKQEAQFTGGNVKILKGGRVAILTDAKEEATTGILFGRGVWVVVYQNGYDIGATRDNKRPELRMDNPEIRQTITEAGELDQWFFHTAGFLACRGSRKAHAPSPSKVDVRKLAEVIRRLADAVPA